MLSTAAIMGLAMQCAASIHPDTVKDVARTESSFNPLAIGVVGGPSLYPSSIDDAIKHIERLKANGKNFSVGLMQINQANFTRYGVTTRQLFDPCKNLAIFEKIITDCSARRNLKACSQLLLLWEFYYRTEARTRLLTDYLRPAHRLQPNRR